MYVTYKSEQLNNSLKGLPIPAHLSVFEYGHSSITLQKLPFSFVCRIIIIIVTCEGDPTKLEPIELILLRT